MSSQPDVPFHGLAELLAYTVAQYYLVRGAQLAVTEKRAELTPTGWSRTVTFKEPSGNVLELQLVETSAP